MATTTTGTGVTFSDGTSQSSCAIGYGQSWVDVTGSRALNTTYTNSTGRPIQVYVNVGSHNNGTATSSLPAKLPLVAHHKE